MAVANLPEHFSKQFLAELEPRSPFRFGFLRARRDRLTGRKGLYESLFNAFVEAGDADLGGLPQPELWMEYALNADAEQCYQRAAGGTSFA
jgi:hypothetical protein